MCCIDRLNPHLEPDGRGKEISRSNLAALCQQLLSYLGWPVELIAEYVHSPYRYVASKAHVGKEGYLWVAVRNNSNIALIALIALIGVKVQLTQHHGSIQNTLDELSPQTSCT